MRIRSWLDVCDIEVFLGPELFERSGNSRIHMFPGPLIRPGFGEAIWINPRNAVSFSLIPLCRSIHPMPSFDPSSSISKVVYVICRVHLDIEDVGNRCNLIHFQVNITPHCHNIRDWAYMVDLAVTEHPFSVPVGLCRSQQLLDRHWSQGMRGSFLIRIRKHWIPTVGIGARTFAVPGLFSPKGDPCTYPPPKSSVHHVVSALSTGSRGCRYVDSCFNQREWVEIVTVNE